MEIVGNRESRGMEIVGDGDSWGMERVGGWRVSVGDIGITDSEDI